MKYVTPEYTNDATLQSTNLAEADYDLWNSSDTYAINDVRMYIADGHHWIIRSLINSNLNNIPTGLKTDPNWVKISETNRWKMFDLKTTSQTYNNDSIDTTLIGLGFVDSVALLNIDGASVQVTARDQFNNIFYQLNQSLVSTDGIYDPYTYFFNPIVKITDLLYIDLPVYALATYQTVISSPGGIAKCGTLLIGKYIQVGGTQYGMRIGNTDYSIKQADEFGDFVITERAYSRNMNLTAMIENNLVNSLVNNLNNLRATPIVWIGADEFSASFIYGFYKDYDVVVQYVNNSVVNFEIEGLS